VKDNHKSLHEDIREYFEGLRAGAVREPPEDVWETGEERRHGRAERREVRTAADIGRLEGKGNWKDLKMILLIFTAVPFPQTMTGFGGLSAGSLTADLRWQPVILVNSSSKIRLSFLAAFWQQGLYSLVTACLSRIVNPIRMPSSRRPYYHLGNIFNVRHDLFSVTFFMRQRAPLTH
jgi:hypothetical protein